jgi:RHS repeat-associated protein
VGGVTYTWDNNGNLLNDGTNTYTYNYANRLVSLTDGIDSYNYRYNGLSDRVQQTVNGVTTTYVLDLNTGLTQVLSDGTDTYLYGLSRIGEEDTARDYYLGDALESVRQLTNSNGEVSLAQTFEPYGKVWASVGTGSSSYAFTGEMVDPSGLVHLRARYMDPSEGRFISRDTWGGEYSNPLSLNRFMYVAGNPVNYTDPSGHCSTETCKQRAFELEMVYGFEIYWPDRENIQAQPSFDLEDELGKCTDPLIKYHLNVVLTQVYKFEYWDEEDIDSLGEGLLYMSAILAEKGIGVRNFTEDGVLFRYSRRFDNAPAYSCMTSGNCGSLPYDRRYKFSSVDYFIGFSNDWSSNQRRGFIQPWWGPKYASKKSFVVVHEYGHILDGFIGTDISGDMYRIFNYDAGAPSNNAETSPREYFADTFAFYMWENLRGIVPVSFRTGAKQISSIINSQGISLYDYFESEVLTNLRP